jgi:photosystem II stability/assembly factor-like uncharacterized protein
VFVIAGAHAARAGVNVWTTHGPYAPPKVSALAIDPHTPSTLYARTDEGVFRSTNSGGSWSPVNAGLTDPDGNALDIIALVIDPTMPSTLYAGTWWGGVYQSTNSGGSWSPVNTGLSGYALWVIALVIDPSTPSTLYAGTYRAGVFRSTDSGGSWTSVNTGLSVANTLWVGAGRRPAYAEHPLRQWNQWWGCLPEHEQRR